MRRTMVMCLAALLAAAALVAPAACIHREQQSFAVFQWFVGSVGGGYNWFRTGDVLEGPVHVNGDLQINGDPWFGELVTAGGGLTMIAGSNPTFVEGYILNVEQVELPSTSYVEATVRYEAMGGGFYGAPLGDNAYYEVELGVPMLGQFTCSAFDQNGNPIGLPVVVDISALNGAAWFEESIRISGVLDGTLTIGVSGNIEIMDDILYAASTPGSGPDPSCDDMLGLIAAGFPEGNIVVSYTAPNQTDCEIHAVMMALQKNFEVEDYQLYPPRGDLTLYGGVIVDHAVLTGEYSGAGYLVSGYMRDFNYDERMSEDAPPFFPEGTFWGGTPTEKQSWGRIKATYGGPEVE